MIDNLSMKQGSLFVLFCTHEIHQTRMLQIVFLVSLERSHGEGVHRLDFKVISAAENSNKFQKTRLWKEKSVEDVVTLGRMAQATLVSFISRVYQ